MTELNRNEIAHVEGAGAYGAAVGGDAIRRAITGRWEGVPNGGSIKSVIEDAIRRNPRILLT